MSEADLQYSKDEVVHVAVFLEGEILQLYNAWLLVTVDNCYKRLG